MENLKGALQPEMHGGEMDAEIQQLAQTMGQLKPGFGIHRSPRKDRKKLTPHEAEWVRQMAAILLLLLAVVFTAMNITGHGPTALRGPELTHSERQQRLETRLAFTVAEIEVYQAQHQQMPKGVEDLGLPANSGVSLETLGDGHIRVTAKDADTTLFRDWKKTKHGGRS